jgi:hypothetical protein
MTGDTVTAHIERTAYWPLPQPCRADGRPRRTGIEIEFAGLSVQAAADVARSLWDGEVELSGPQVAILRDSDIGVVSILLDTVLVKHGGAPLTDTALEWSRAVIPVEIVTPPLPPERLCEADRMVKALREAGASGTRESLAYGFGVHLNPEIADTDAVAILPVIRAYALLEDWLRQADPIDPMRRFLPFVDPYPRAFVDALADTTAADWSLDELTRVYLAHTPTRNRGLDALPLLECLRPQAVRDVLGEAAKGGRPTWHYRLPEARVDEPGWSIAYEWNRWCIIERVAEDAELLERLALGWQVHRAMLINLRSEWAQAVEEALYEAEIWNR